ncbi:hypothetical protein DICPUDRAFT_158606 [Dictyostelium purpureum]|uniref:Rho-GAP domain-containing protein n=1 Tax=Dictyostelium purpureum TaxID=5786 RepID=F1A213_DICPU|nr:uncharacterized protein DICPUDRAFT_158606 [Dictyostelium purpureum]EGC29763.1 hypothetical protein DICPUDRAFT_158606 [Dictyostelium purpureum]|eukprot:XP_003293709.1 hypothetical protein DICPUDRAFT_158606 [Dictyostelium purpureum]
MKFGKKKEKDNENLGENVNEKQEKPEKKKEKKEKQGKTKKKDEVIESAPTKKIFGGSLPFLYEEELPSILVQCIDYLECYGLQTPGIFRENGSLSSIQNYRQMFDQGKPVQFPQHEAHVVASLLKAYLRELKDPLCTFEHYDMFVACESISDEKVKVELLKKVITHLPPYNRKVFKYICSFLLKVVENSEVNKMSPDALSVVFLPTILRPKANTDLEILQFTVEDSKSTKTLMSSILLNYEEIFEDPTLFQPRRARAQTDFVSPSSSQNSTASMLSQKAALSPRSPAQTSPNFSPQNTPTLNGGNSNSSLPTSLPQLTPISTAPSSTISALVDLQQYKQPLPLPPLSSLPLPPPPQSNSSAAPPSIGSILPPPPPLPNKKDCKINLNNYNLLPNPNANSNSNPTILPPIESNPAPIAIPVTAIETKQDNNLTPTKQDNLHNNISPRNGNNLPALPPKPPSLTLPTLPPKPIPKVPNSNIFDIENVRQRSNTTFV